jgi:hypothetical protein
MERIEPIRRDDATRSVPAVTPVAGRDRERRREDERRRERRGQADSSSPAITRDDDGTPHVDLRA